MFWSDDDDLRSLEELLRTFAAYDEPVLMPWNRDRDRLQLGLPSLQLCLDQFHRMLHRRLVAYEHDLPMRYVRADADGSFGCGFQHLLLDGGKAGSDEG